MTITGICYRFSMINKIYDHTIEGDIPFTGEERVFTVTTRDTHETTVKKLVTDPDTGKEVVKEEKIIQFGEFVEDKKKLPNYHEYAVSSSKHIGIVKVTIEPDED